MEREEGPRRLAVLVVGGSGEASEDARGLTSFLMAELGRDGFDFWYAGDPAEAEGGRLHLFDAVLVHPAGLETASRRDQALREAMAAGVGLILPVGGGDALTAAAPEGARIVRLDLDGHPMRRDADTAFGERAREAVLDAVAPRTRQAWDDYELPPIRYVESPVPIPTYDEREFTDRLQEPLGPEESLRQLQIPPGFEVELFASEPDIVNPIAMDFDERGRLWIAESLDYPNELRPDGRGNDVIRILEDTDRDGRADRFTVFADELNLATGFTFARGGVVVAAVPRFLFLADTTGDDRADVREELLTGWSTRDTHAGPSNLQYGFDNRIWGTVGYAGFDGTVGGEEMEFGAGVYRMAPDASELEFLSEFTNNAWGLGFSESFDVFGSTANNEHSVQVAIPNRYFREAEDLPDTRPPQGGGRKRLDTHYDLHPLTRELRQVDYPGGFTSAAGHRLYTARSFPREYWNRVVLVGDPTGHLLHRAVLDRVGSGFRETDGWNLLASPDEWVSPVAAQVGPDGAVWVLDWYNFIAQHSPTPPGFTTGAGAAYDTPLRDRQHGRIYRISWKGASEPEPMELSIDRPEELVEALGHHNLFWRLTAQRLLVERGRTDVVPDLHRLLSGRSLDELDLDPAAIHAIWTLHGLGALEGSDESTEREVRWALQHPSAGVRRSAVMALPREPALFAHLREAGALEDEDPAVRVQALLALAEIPASTDAGERLYELSLDPSILEDEWLPTALFLAALHHREGFLGAYGEELGALEFARLAGRAARGELDAGVDWSDPDLDESGWEPIPVPALWTTTELGHFFGVVWYRHEFDVPEGAAGGSATIGLGPITDADVTYLNGVPIGATDEQPGQPRSYAVPDGLLREGRNVLAVQVTNRRRGGGIWGEPELLVAEGPAFRVPLTGTWLHRVAEVWPGGRQPSFATGVPFAEQFLRYHNPIGPVDAVVPTAGASPEEADADVRLTLEAVPLENRYDLAELEVGAGERISLVFDNADDMLHNVVVLGAGYQLEEVGGLLDAYVGDPEAVGRDYIPPDLEVVGATDMANPGETAAVVFTAPEEPGEYLFVCTVPGHWRTMWGILRVEG